MDQYAEEKRTEKNLIVRSGISEAETTNNKRLRSMLVLKLYRHEASRGFFAIAELLVLPVMTDDSNINTQLQCISRVMGNIKTA